MKRGLISTLILFLAFFTSGSAFSSILDGRWKMVETYSGSKNSQKVNSIGFIEFFRSGDFLSVHYEVRVIPGNFNSSLELVTGDLKGKTIIKEYRIDGKFNNLDDKNVKLSYYDNYRRPQSSIRSFELVNGRLEMSDINGMVSVYKKWEKEDEDRRLAYALFAENRHEEALPYLEEQAISDLEARKILMNYYYAKRKYYPAINFLEGLLLKTHVDYENLAAFYRLNKDVGGAITAYTNANTMVADFYLAWIYATHPNHLNPHKAFVLLNKHLRHIDALVGVYDRYNIAAAVFARNKQYDLALRYHKKALDGGSFKQGVIRALYEERMSYDVTMDLDRQWAIVKEKRRIRGVYSQLGNILTYYPDQDINFYSGGINQAKAYGKTMLFKDMGEVVLRKRTEKEIAESSDADKYKDYAVSFYNKINGEYIVVIFRKKDSAEDFLRNLQIVYNKWQDEVKTILADKDRPEFKNLV